MSEVSKKPRTMGQIARSISNKTLKEIKESSPTIRWEIWMINEVIDHLKQEAKVL